MKAIILLGFIFYTNLIYSQTKVKTTPEDFQFISWAVKDFDASENKTVYTLGAPLKNNLNNRYFFEYVPVYREKQYHVGYALKFWNRQTDEVKWLGIPFINVNELQNLFDQLMGWKQDERDAFLKSFILFQQLNTVQ